MILVGRVEAATVEGDAQCMWFDHTTPTGRVSCLLKLVWLKAYVALQVFKELISLVYTFAEYLVFEVYQLAFARHRVLSLEAQAFLDLIMMSLCLWFFYRILAHMCRSIGKIFRPYQLIKKMTDKKPEYIGKRYDEKKERWVTDFIINGETHTIIHNAVDVDDHRDMTNQAIADEMALPGSTLYPSSKRNVGAICVEESETEGPIGLRVIGLFWRSDDYLVTAAHVANVVANGTSKVFLVGVEEYKRDKCRLRYKNPLAVDTDLFDLDANLNPDDSIDVFIIKMNPKHWSFLAVGASSTAKESCYGQVVSAVGFNSDGLLMTSPGKTLAGSGVSELWHTATTHPGFSGAPLYCGKHVVGIHTGHADGHNRAVRVEAVLRLVKTGEEASESFEIEEEDAREIKIGGRRATVRELDDGALVAEFRNGAVRFFDDDDVEEYRTKLERRDEMLQAEMRDRQELEKVIEAKIQACKMRPGSWLEPLPVNASWADESAPTQQNEVAVVPEKVPDSGVYVAEQKKSVHVQSPMAMVPEVVAYLESKAEELEKIGYEPHKYVMPESTYETEETSVRKHLELYELNCNTVTRPPTAEELKRAHKIMMVRLQHLRFPVKKGYKSKANIASIIDSNRVKDKKSPGYPYKEMGLATNEQVIKRYGVEGFADLVLQQWDDDYEYAQFAKAGAEKASKIDKGMQRVVSSHPLHKLVKNHALFGALAERTLTQWRKSPVKYAFNPLQAGHIEHLRKTLGPGKKWESDKPTWDYSFYAWFYDAIQEIVKELAVAGVDVTPEEMIEYSLEVEKEFQSVKKAKAFRCSNGKVYATKRDGIMKSGWFLTIFCNSVAQDLLDVLIFIRAGMTDDEIINLPMVAGGDDVLRSAPKNLTVVRYNELARELGFETTVKEIDSFEGSEFFSSQFFEENGVLTFVPQRFSKCVKHLSATSVENLSGALISHMQNYCWVDEKFRFFERMFVEFTNTHPDLFDYGQLVPQRMLQYKVLGVESSFSKLKKPKNVKGKENVELNLSCGCCNQN